MEAHKDNLRPQFENSDLEEIKEQYSIENDTDKLEPFIDESENREINPNDFYDLVHWAEQFQIGVEELKAAIVINGNKVKEIKKYLSV